MDAVWWAAISLIAVSLVVGLALAFGLNEVEDDEPPS